MTQLSNVSLRQQRSISALCRCALESHLFPVSVLSKSGLTVFTNQYPVTLRLELGAKLKLIILVIRYAKRGQRRAPINRSWLPGHCRIASFEFLDSELLAFICYLQANPFVVPVIRRVTRLLLISYLFINLPISKLLCFFSMKYTARPNFAARILKAFGFPCLFSIFSK